MIKQNLLTLRDLLSDKSKWTQEVCARDKNDEEVSPGSEEACKWCLVGALMRIDLHTEKEHDEICIYLNKKIGGIGTFNDTHSHEEVMQKLDELITGAPC